MRYQTLPSAAQVAVLAGALAGLLLVVPASLGAQSGSGAPPDSARLVEEARKRQRDFELFRASRIPVVREPSGYNCDQQIGRFCIWFGGEEGERFPPEAPETGQARHSLIAFLLQVRQQVADRWVTGQLVHYLVEDENLAGAEQVAGECGIVESWWCLALEGYALHAGGDFVEAEAAFREALESMPEDERRRWDTPRYILTPDGVKDFERADPAERSRQWELFWRLSDPLFLLDGNDRLTDHLARWVEVRNQEDAGNTQFMDWDVDMEETLVRYGRHIGWSRTHDPTRMFGGKALDTRRVVGHHHPKSRGYLFPEAFLRSPSDIPPESWITAPREARTWYAPPYAPDFRGLETQVGRFRRGEEMLVVGAYQPAVGAGTEGEAANPFARIEGPVRSALFLVPVDGEEVVQAQGADAQGVFTLHAPPGRYVSSLEVLDENAKRAWRARQGVSQVSLVPGLVAVSDLLILKRDAPLPESLDEAIPHVRPGVRLRKGERFAVAWEVYGLGVREPVRVTIGYTRGRPGFLARVGEFLGVVEPDRELELSFEDTGPDQVQTAFRAVFLELPDLEPGEYTLHLRLDLPGREPAITSRPIVVQG